MRKGRAATRFFSASLLALCLLAPLACVPGSSREDEAVVAASRAAGRQTLQAQPGGQAGQVGQDGRTGLAVRVEVDASRTLRPISPLIYGVSVASQACLEGTGARLNRWGGNPNSRYNWESNAWNAARDWEFRNYGAPNSEDTAPSAAMDRFVALNATLGAASMVTVPALGWVAKDRLNESRSLDVPAHGDRPVDEAGAIAGYDPARNRSATSLRSLPRAPAGVGDEPPNLADDVVYQDAWVRHLVRRFGPAALNGVGYYVVDNEPDLWAETHGDVHPAQPGYDELLSTFLDYAGAIKDADPTARVAGPALSGWMGLFHSPRDRLTAQPLALWAARRALTPHFATLLDSDRRNHGGEALLPWWLAQVRQHDARTGRRTLDVLDVHFYPQAPFVFSDRADASTTALRLRSTRALWDPSYRDESWIGEPVRLLPRLREWIDQHYPGTQLAIGEWNWGAERTIGGGLAAADVLGIFGREGVDLAAYWTCPPEGSPVARAFTLYTNVDGRGGGFGDLALPVTFPTAGATAAGGTGPGAASSNTASSASQTRNPFVDAMVVYAARSSATGQVTVIALNKQPATPVQLSLTVHGAALERAQLFRLGADLPTSIRALGEQPADRGTLTLTLPPHSATFIRSTGA